MFDYPPPPLNYGLYNELGLGPEATSEEISEARQELTIRLKARQKSLQRAMESVFSRGMDSQGLSGSASDAIQWHLRLSCACPLRAGVPQAS